MADGDTLLDLIALARREIDDVPPEAWERFAALASLHFGTRRIYVPANRKRRNLDAIAAADDEASAEKIAAMLGVSVRHVRRLRSLG
jgi:hypothetical protein